MKQFEVHVNIQVYFTKCHNLMFNIYISSNGASSDINTSFMSGVSHGEWRRDWTGGSTHNKQWSKLWHCPEGGRFWACPNCLEQFLPMPLAVA